MASGCFPFCTTDDEARKLLDIKKQLQEFLNEWSSVVSSGDSGGMQLDNAASDGGYLERINIAIEMIDGCLYKPKKQIEV